MKPSRPLIAHVVYRFDVGGLENGVVNLINHLPADRYDHAVIALTEVTDFQRRITRERVTFHSLHKPPGHGVAIYRDLYRLFRRLRPAVVHTRNIAASEAHVPAMLARVPIRVHGEHGWEVHDVAHDVGHDVAQDTRGGKRSHRWQRRLLRPLIHRHVALSGEIRRYLEQRIAVPPADIAQICNGVDIDRFAARASPEKGRAGPVAERFPEPGLFIVGTVGRLSPVKNQRLLIDAFVRACALLDERQPGDARRLRLVIAGDGPDRAALETQVASSSVADRIWTTGARDDVPELMAGLDLFVLPSLAEGISNTILEAMACGTPVLATRVGGNGELIDDGRTGKLVPSDDAMAMAVAIGDYAFDASRGRAEGAAGRERVVAHFSIDAMVSKYAELYDGLLDLRGARSDRSLIRAATGADPALGPGHR